MTFGDLTITQGIAPTPYAVVSIGSEVVAHVLNVQAAAITASSVVGLQSGVNPGAKPSNRRTLKRVTKNESL